ncbi:RNA-binding protein 42-like [Ctenocephalides felis]|uniref:RNA-binding protein 42-like n=1 Tax=Ctenocephalides felis TaxID=7515 RepID=UPI000E6E1B76|nr:RNA-binding protein 42-like [Ctenocephalides felis]
MASNDKFRIMEDEMSRFEAEISVEQSALMHQQTMARPVIGVNTYNQVQQQLQQIAPDPMVHQSIGFPMMSSFTSIAQPPPPMMLPTQLQRLMQHTVDPMENIQETLTPYEPPPQVYSAEPVLIAKPTVLSSEPKLYKPVVEEKKSKVDISSMQIDITNRINRIKSESHGSKQVAPTNEMAAVAIMQGKASSSLQSFGDDRPRKKNKKLIRTAGGQTWEDPSLQDWEDDDFRIFCGDLGNDVTDELLIRTFNKYPSFLKAKVIRDKRTNKSKGFGFISFKDPADFIKAMKEMDGRYVGSRPIKLRKSCWKNRSLDVVRKKEKEKQALLNMLTSNTRQF